jgi:hypothetical protein
MSEKLIIGKPQYECPICGEVWYEYDLFHLDTFGCPGCKKKFNLSLYLHEDEVLWSDWRQKCYFRMLKEYDRNSDGDKLIEEYEAMFDEIQESESNLFNQILKDERNENTK